MRQEERDNGYNRDLTVADLVERTRKATGIALVFGDRRLSYEEYHSITDRIASALKKRGITKRNIVAVSMPKSERLYCAVFGIIKSGAAYLINNMDWPESRQNYVLENAGAAFVITEDNYGELSGKLTRGLTDREAANNSRSLERCFTEASDVPTAEDVCAVYYTSGSSGNPKGVMLTHRNIVSIFYPRKGSFSAYEGYLKCSSVLDAANPSYVAALNLTAVSLFAGKKQVLLQAGELADLEKVSKIMETEKTDFMVATPSMMGAFMRNASFKKALRLMRVITFGGEAASQELMDAIAGAAADHAVLLNMYGATEAPGMLNAYLCGNRVSMGYPLPCVKLYLLNEDGREVADGETGEICVGGDGVAKGYIGLEELEREKFTDRADGDRIYHTGDRGRRGENGEIFYAGRMDRMVKINGLRIELPEVEQEIGKLTDIMGTAVKICIDGNGSRILTAFYTTKNGEECGEMREKLTVTLPYYMVPAVFVHLKEMPLTDRGKTDYTKLALPEEMVRKEPYKAPSGEKEAAVCHAFEKALQGNQIGSDESFYELGGDSLTGMLVLAELRTRGYTISMQELFFHPTARKLAPYLEAAREEENSVPDEKYLLGDILCLTQERTEAEKIIAGTADPGNVEAWIPLSGPERKFLTLPEKDRYLNRYYLDDMVVAEKAMTEEEFKRKAENFVRCHPVCRSAIFSEGLSRPCQIVFRKANPRFFYHDIRKEYDAEKMPAESFWKRLDEEVSFIPESPLFVMGCFRLTDKMCVILLHTFHTVFDGLSTNRFFEKILSDTEETEEDSYLSYRKWLYRKQNEEKKKAEVFWKEYLKKPPIGILPLKSLLSAGICIRCETIVLDREQNEKLTRVCADRKTTVETWLQYVYGLSLMDVLHRDDVLYRATFSGWTSELNNMENTVGMLMKQVPVRQRKNESLEEYLQKLWELQEYSYADMETIWEAVLGKEIVPPLDGGIIGDVFPHRSDKIRKEYHRNDALVSGNDIHPEEGKLIIRFQFDSCHTDENAVHALCAGMRRRIMGALA